MKMHTGRLLRSGEQPVLLKRARRIQELLAGLLIAQIALVLTGVGHGVAFLLVMIATAVSFSCLSGQVSNLRWGQPAGKVWPKAERVGKIGGERVVFADGRFSVTAVASAERYLFDRVFHCFRHDHLVLLGDDRACPVCGGDDSGSMWRTPETHHQEQNWGGGGGGGGEYAIGVGLPPTLVHRALELCWQATAGKVDPYTAWRRCAVVLDNMEAFRAEPGYPDLAARVRKVRDQVEPDAQRMAASRDMAEIRTIGDPPGWGPWVPGALR